MSEWRKIKTYASRPEAEVDRLVLEEAGIPAVISADDVGGMYPANIFLEGVNLLVEDVDAYKACMILNIEPPPKP